MAFEKVSQAHKYKEPVWSSAKWKIWKCLIAVMKLSYNHKKIPPFPAETFCELKIILCQGQSPKWLRKDVRLSQTVATPTWCSSQKSLHKDQCEPNQQQLHRENRATGLVRCDGTSTRGPHSALDIHLLSDHLSVTFPRLCPAWSPQVLDDTADMHCWRVTGFWRGPRVSSRLRQVLPYMMSDMRTDGLQSKTRSHLQGLAGTKRLIWESAQGPLEPAALRALCRRMTSSCSPKAYRNLHL